MKQILEGVQRFKSEIYPSQKEVFEHLAVKQQRPTALFITCSDSRIEPNLITQTEPGTLFMLRNAGNMVPPYGAANGGEGATIEYAVSVLGVRNIIICGHSQCGAMKAILNYESLKGLPSVLSWCQHAEATRQICLQKYQGLPPEELHVLATEENVLVQMSNLTTHPSVAVKLALGELKIFGWYYDIASGTVLEYDQEIGTFQPLTETPHCVTSILAREPSVNGA